MAFFISASFSFTLFIFLAMMGMEHPVNVLFPFTGRIKNAQSSRLQGVKLHNGQPLDLTSAMGSFPRPPQTILQQEDGKSKRRETGGEARQQEGGVKLLKKGRERFEREVRNLYEIEKVLDQEGQSDGERSYKVFVATILLFIDDSLRYICTALSILAGLVIGKILSGLL